MADRTELVVIRDTREQKGWDFAPDGRMREYSFTTVDRALPTGDYTLVGLEGSLCIERKGSVVELAGNLLQKRFENCLVRMREYSHAHVICEFTYDDLVKFPLGLDWKVRRAVKVRGPFLLKRMVELSMHYHVPFHLAGAHGRALALSIMKRAYESDAQAKTAG